MKYNLTFGHYSSRTNSDYHKEQVTAPADLWGYNEYINALSGQSMTKQIRVQTRRMGKTMAFGLLYGMSMTGTNCSLVVL